MPDGFSLNVDPKFLQDLEKAEQKLKDIAETSDKTSKAIIKNFQEATDKGIGYFLSQMRKANEQLLSFSNASKSMKIGDVSGLSSMNKMASQSTDIINKLIDALVKLSSEQSKSKSSSSKDSDVSKINSLYRERIKLMKQLEHFAQLGAKGVTLTNEESSSISSIHQRLQVIDMEIKSYQKRTDLSKQAIRSLIQGEADFSIAQGNEIRKRQKLVEDENRKKEDKVRQEALHNEKLASLDKKRAEDIVKQQQKELNDYRAYLKSKQDMYKRMFDQIAKQESQMRSKSYNRFQASGDTSNQATAAYNRLYGEHGIKSVNNMNRALQRLQDAQNKLNLNTDKGRQKYDELGKKIQQIKRDLDKATQANEKFHNSHSKLLNTTDQLQRKLALLFSISAIQGYMDKLVNVRKEFELQQKSLQVLLRDKDQADKLWQQTIDLAVKSPFRVSQLVSYTKQLAAYRIESDKLYDTTKMLSDVSAGLGVDMQRIILAFGQVRAANFLRGTELRQFTEAGIPMLDELAQMFTELEGRVVKAGDVFERISKRMVTFRDVEEVFKRMTSSSGVFYNMQEEQSKTLFGMISNLHDSIDLMLNDIGRSNDGIIKDMVSLTRDLVENWRGVATVLKQVGVTLAMIGLAKFATGWKIASTAITTGSTSAALAMNGMAGSAARLRIAMSTLGKTISANPWFLLAGAVASVGHALWEYIDAIDAANAKYDDMSRREIAHIDQLEELQKKTEQYNAIIEDGNSSEQARNKAQLENDKILSQIKAKNPELYPLIVKQTNGTIDLTKAIEEQNEKLIENIALQQKAKGGFFQETLDENYKESIDAFGKLESSLSNFKVVAMEAQSKLGQALHDGLISQGDYDRFSELLSVIRKSKDFKQLHKAFNDLTSAIVRNGKEVTKQVPLLGMFANEWVKVVNSADSYKDALDDLRDNFKNQKNILKVGIQDAFDEAGGGEYGAKAAGEYISSFLDKFNIVDKNIRKWAEEEIPKLVEVKFDVIYPTKETTASELEPWAKRVKDAIENINNKIKASNKDVKDTDLFPIPEPGQMREQYLNVANAVLDVAKATYREGQKIVDDNIVKQTKMLKPFASEVEAILNIDDKNKGNGKGKDWMSEVVKGIKEAHQEYIKLNKTLEDSEAKQLALNKYAKSFAESAKNAGLKDISLGQFKFETEEGAIEALTFLKNKLPQSAKQARFKLEEAIGEIRGEVRIRTKAEDDKLLIDKIEDMFSGYEMSIELQKLNIPPDLAKQLFNVDSVDLSSIRNKISSELAKAQATGGQENRVNELKKQLDKVEEMEDKAMKERLKKYVKYLVQAQGERVKIKMDEIRQLAEIEKEDRFTSEQKSSIKRQIRIETQESLDKQAWEDFKNSEMYTQMFEDLEYLGEQAITNLRHKLELLKSSLSDLPASDVKEIMTQIKKLEELEIKYNPFSSMRDAIKEVDDLRKNGKTEEMLQMEMQAAQANIESYTNEKEAIAQIIEALHNKNDANLLSNDIANEYRHLLMLSKDDLEAMSNSLDKKIQKEEESAKNAGIDLAKYTKARKATQGFVDNITAWGEAISGVLGGVDSILDAFGVAEDDSSRLFVQSAQQIADMVVQTVILTASLYAMGVAANSALGIIGLIATGLQAVGMLFAGIFAAGDKKKERQIKREQELVDKLQKAYEKLGEEIENAYKIDTFEAAIDQSQKNLKQQIAATERMIALEEDKKKTDKDKIKEWKDEIEEMREMLDELEEERIQGLGGFGNKEAYKSATEDFVNAWLDAYKETGDGLSGLEEQFKEFFENMVKNQLMMRGVDKFLDPLYKQFDEMFSENSDLGGKVSKNEIDAIKSMWATISPELNTFMQGLVESLGISSDLTSGATEMSGLQRGIQEIHESTAQEIAAYLNSIRFFVADSNTKLSQLASVIVGGEDTANPILSELRTQTELVRGISTLLNSVVRGSHSMGGQGIKVFIS